MKKGENEKYREIIPLLIGEEDEEAKIQIDLEIQIKKELKDPCEFQYLEKVMSTRRGRIYRSGEINGNRIMTYDDYTRLLINESRIVQYGKGQNLCESHSEPDFVKPATAYQVITSGKNLNTTNDFFSSVETIISSNRVALSRTEISDTTRFGALLRFINQWMPVGTVVKPSLAERRRMATSSFAGIAWVLIFAFVLALPLVISTMKIGVIDSINNNRDTLERLQKEETRLEADYETSIDLRDIDFIARNELGMVPASEATVNLLILNPNDQIEFFDDKESMGLLPTLLSALGIQVAEN